MSKSTFWCVLLVVGIVAITFFYPDLSFAAGYGGFEGKMQGLTNNLVGKLLPMVSIVALVYACILALTGSGEAKGKILMVIGCSVVGFLAPYIITWFQGAVG